MKVLIIEDEILASRHLKQLLSEAGNMDVVDTLESIAETIEWFGRNAQPDIVFMDIHLADGAACGVHVAVDNHGWNIAGEVVFEKAFAQRTGKDQAVNHLGLQKRNAGLFAFGFVVGVAEDDRKAQLVGNVLNAARNFRK